MGIKVLSLFDGISCGRLALERAGIEVDNYYSSEIDKFAIKVADKNYPDNIHIGDVRNVDVFSLPPIDLVIGGSPCTNLSFAGKGQGLETMSLDQYLVLKADGFPFEGQSVLFWEYVRILKDVLTVNPKASFLLENVKMSKQWKEKMTEVLFITIMGDDWVVYGD